VIEPIQGAGARLTPGLMDTRRVTSEKSATDLVERARASVEAHDRDEAISFYAPDAVWDATPWGMGRFEGREAILGFFEDWRGSYSGLAFEAEEIRDLGNGITFDVIVQEGRPLGSSGVVQLRYASVTEWVDNLIVSNTTYTDIDEARVAAERLAEERA
jgi:ketosteroid isomerase-like protein